MNTKEPFVITISREIGSGGHTVGKILADKLQVKYCDKQLLNALMERFNMTGYSVEKLKGEKDNWLTAFIKTMSNSRIEGPMVDPRFNPDFRRDVTTDDIFAAEVEILKKLASEGSCVIAGRSGFHVFKDHPNKLNVFITASMPKRIERVMNKQGLTEETAAVLIKDIDEKRENYIKRYTGTTRYDVHNYDLVLNADGHTEEQLAEIILAYIG